MLADHLERQGHKVACFTKHKTQPANTLGDEPEAWFGTEEADAVWCLDIQAASSCDLLIYVGPSGADAWAEVGVALGVALSGGFPAVFGLLAKGDQIGINRKMVECWFADYKALLAAVAEKARVRAIG